jgi:hypothetical protein
MPKGCFIPQRSTCGKLILVDGPRRDLGIEMCHRLAPLTHSRAWCGHTLCENTHEPDAREGHYQNGLPQSQLVVFDVTLWDA